MTTTVPRIADEAMLCCLGPAFPELETSGPAWISRIAAELAYGFTQLRHLPKAVSVFGSARLPEARPACLLATETAQMAGQAGFATDDPAEVTELVKQAWREQPGSLHACAHQTGTLT